MNSKKTLFLIFILFLASFATRFYFAYFNKIILIYPDELRYLHLAQNFAELKGLEIYNLPTNFQKILYPLFLSPAFFFENIASQQFCIALIHSFLVASSIFPVFLIAKTLLKSNTNILIICSISIFMVDLAYSMTFMSEILFLPLSLWLFYGFSKLIIKEREREREQKVYQLVHCFRHSFLCRLFMQRSRHCISFLFFALCCSSTFFKNSAEFKRKFKMLYHHYFNIFSLVYFNETHIFCRTR